MNAETPSEQGSGVVDPGASLPSISAFGDDSLAVVAVPDHPFALRVLSGLADCLRDVVRLEHRYSKDASGAWT